MWDKLTNLQSLIKQAAELGKQAEHIRGELRTKTVEASVGGGMVTVRANGLADVISISIDPSLLVPEEREMVQELVAAAVNEAAHKARELARQELSALTGGIDVAGMMGMS